MIRTLVILSGLAAVDSGVCSLGQSCLFVFWELELEDCVGLAQ